MKILVLDIETRPSLGYVWQLWDQNVGLSQLVEVGEVICFAAKWLDKKKIYFKSVHHHSKEEMVQTAWDLMNEAHAIVHYNGKSFDIKHLQREFILHELTPPSPHKDIDLLTVTKSKFKFVSNKLDHVADQLGLGSKTDHSGFQLWLDCMADDKNAWALMRKYNINDVLLTEKLYYKLRPWITTHPNVPLYEGNEQPACRVCNSEDIQFRGYDYTATVKYHRFVCKSCGKWDKLAIKQAELYSALIGN